MKSFSKNLFLSTLCFSLPLFGIAHAKAVVNKYAQTQNGKMPENLRDELGQDVIQAKGSMTQEHYVEVVSNPQAAVNDQERLAGLSAREIIIMVDASGSMGARDANPTGAIDKPKKHFWSSSSSSSWTRWDSAKIATESIAEVAISMDRDCSVDVILWNGNIFEKTVTNPGQVSAIFSSHSPGGSTPLFEALEHVYNKKLHAMLQRGEPFTVIIMTDGAPNDQGKVKQFFKKVIKDNRLEAPGRETLAAFSFVRMGDDDGAKTFLGDLDDNLISQLSVNVDIVDTKEDNFLFGTGSYKGSDKTGPFALFWDAIYD